MVAVQLDEITWHTHIYSIKVEISTQANLHLSKDVLRLYSASCDHQAILSYPDSTFNSRKSLLLAHNRV